MERKVHDIELVLGDSLKNTEKGKEIKKFFENFQKMRVTEIENK